MPKIEITYMKIITSILSLTAIAFAANGQLKSPAEFLGYELGDKFTWHHRIVDYYEHVASEQSNVILRPYGTTYEGRSLITAIVSSQENINNWEQIRADNLKRAGIESGGPSTNVAIVWLSYNVHGNESVSSEATMQTLYELADPGNNKTQNWLKNTVVILDPCINPDGRDRYANFYNQYGNKDPNPDQNSQEHIEPWPGGRANHYLFDLNRDWAWQTQVESQQRMAYYNDVLPHVHVDFHEQFRNNPYYFAPAAEPFHEVITNWQREFQTMIGKNHAKYFDEQGWIYFTKEVFDLFYPSYGDTYPTYNGAIGMTYEKGGGGSAGLAGMMNNGDTVTLKDRILHHHTTGLSTVEITSQNADRVVSEFSNYFSTGRTSPQGTYKSYIIKSSNNKDKIARLTKWLQDQDIQFGYAPAGRNKRGFNYRSGNTETFTIESNDLLISLYQPKSRLIKVLFEPESKLVDSLTYDITAWSIPYVYDLEAFAMTERLNVSGAYQASSFKNLSGNEKPYAYLAPYQSINDVKFMAQVMKEGVKIRVAEKDFSVGGRNYSKGTMVLLRWDNEHIGTRFDQVVKAASDQFNKEVFTTSTGFVERGKDLGSGFVNVIKTPRIAVLSGPQTSSLSFGEIWHFFERQIDYPISVLNTDYVKNVDLAEYDVFIIPSGFYRLFDDDYLKTINEWVRDGGRLILIDGALRSFVDQEGFGLKRFASEEDKKQRQGKSEAGDELLKKYEDRQREGISNSISGAIFKTTVDNTHPLGFGYPDHYFTLKRSGARYAYLNRGWNVGVIKRKGDLVSGFTGSDALDQIDQTLVFGVENIGGGTVVYLVDNPLFRAFWHNGKVLFSNAVFMVGQ